LAPIGKAGTRHLDAKCPPDQPRLWPPAIRRALTTMHGLTASLTSLSLGIARMALGGCSTVTATAIAENTSAVQSFAR